MKLTPSASYLTLLLEIFETQIIPDLQSTFVKDNSTYVLEILRELLRRECSYPDALAAINEEGAAIVEDMRAALEAKPAMQVSPRRTRGDGHADSVIEFGDLCETLANLSESMLQQNIDKAPRARLMRRAADWECISHARLLELGVPKVVEDENHQSDPLPREVFHRYLQSVHPDGDKVRVTGFSRVPGGFGKQTWIAAVEAPTSGSKDLIVRKSGRITTCSHPFFDLDREFHLVAAINRAGFLAPKPLWMASEVPGADAPFYVMERLPGKPPGSFLGGAPKLPESFILQLAELLARLHAIPLESFTDFIHKYDSPSVLSETVEQTYRRYIADFRDYAKEMKHLPSPALVYLFNWLAENVPKDGNKPVLVHGDFTIHNMLEEEGAVTGVLDWETASFGSPLMDLGYVKQVVEKHMDWSRFLSHYVACSGRNIDMSALPYYEAFTSLRGLLSLNRGTLLVQEGAIREARFTLFELGVNPKFMKLGLDAAMHSSIQG